MFEQSIDMLVQGDIKKKEELTNTRKNNILKIEEEIEEKHEKAIRGLERLAFDKRASADFAASLSDKIEKIEKELENERKTTIDDYNKKQDNEDKEAIAKIYNKIFFDVFKELNDTKEKMMVIARSYEDSSNDLNNALKNHSDDLLELKLLEFNNNVMFLNKSIEQIKSIQDKLNKIFNENLQKYDFSKMTITEIEDLALEIKNDMETVSLLADLTKEVNEYELPKKENNKKSVDDNKKNIDKTKTDNDLKLNEKVVTITKATNDLLEEFTKEVANIKDAINSGLARKSMIEKLEKLYNELISTNLDENTKDNAKKSLDEIKDEFSKMQINPVVKKMLELFKKIREDNNITNVLLLNEIINQQKLVEDPKSKVTDEYKKQIKEEINNLHNDIINLYLNNLSSLDGADKTDEIKDEFIKLSNDVKGFFTKEDEKKIIILVEKVKKSTLTEGNILSLKKLMQDEITILEDETEEEKTDIIVIQKHRENLVEFGKQINEINNDVAVKYVRDKYNDLVDKYTIINNIIISNENLTMAKNIQEENEYFHNEYSFKEMVKITGNNIKNVVSGLGLTYVNSNIRALHAQNTISKLAPKVRLYGVNGLKENKINYRIYKRNNKVLAKGLYKALTNTDRYTLETDNMFEQWIRLLAYTPENGFMYGFKKLKFEDVAKYAYDFFVSNKSTIDEDKYNTYLNNFLAICRTKDSIEAYDFANTSFDKVINDDVKGTLIPVTYKEVIPEIENLLKLSA